MYCTLWSTIRNSSRTISPGYDGKGGIVFRPGYLPILDVKPFQDRLTQQPPLVKITLLVDLIKLGSKLKGNLKVSLYQVLAVLLRLNSTLTPFLASVRL